MYNQIGLIYDACDDYEDALTWYQKSVDFKKKLGDRAGLATTLHNMGYIAMVKEDWSDALNYFKRSRDLSQEINLDKDVREEEEMMAQVQQKQKK